MKLVRRVASLLPRVLLLLCIMFYSKSGQQRVNSQRKDCRENFGMGLVKFI